MEENLNIALDQNLSNQTNLNQFVTVSNTTAVPINFIDWMWMKDSYNLWDNNVTTIETQNSFDTNTSPITMYPTPTQPSSPVDCTTSSTPYVSPLMIDIKKYNYGMITDTVVECDCILFGKEKSSYSGGQSYVKLYTSNFWHYYAAPYLSYFVFIHDSESDKNIFGSNDIFTDNACNYYIASAMNENVIQANSYSKFNINLSPYTLKTLQFQQVNKSGSGCCGFIDDPTIIGNPPSTTTIGYRPSYI